MSQIARVVIIGAGFGGLYTARGFTGKDVSVTLIDRNNFHTFTPLLYQVATSALDPSTVAYPVRSIFRRADNIHFLMGDAEEIDYSRKRVTVRANGETRQLDYDYLVIAAGSVTNYFGNESFARNTFGLKDLDDAVIIRQRILRQFERAVWIEDKIEKTALTTFVVVGGGPTGLESAGALYELYNFVLRNEFRDRPDLCARVILVEASDHLLDPYPQSLRESAKRQLESLGVELMLNSMVAEVAADHIRMGNGFVIPTYMVIWTAGVKASPLAGMLDVELARDGRSPVKPTLEVIGREAIYAIGDIAYLEDARGVPYPQLIPVAIQQGKLAARNILREIDSEAKIAFEYRDRGIMATIGRSRAVAWIYNRGKVSGFPAWIAWLFLHLIMLLGFNNRVKVFISWIWNYLTYDRSVRIIIDRSMKDRQIIYRSKHKQMDTDEAMT